mmetsp:Transcript_3410/g.4485  ORF Transcript_3410/g.4485 Transcript_3410/m.4485 type:complete len:243 (-) Transcript_3410:867-1595(-)
MDLFRCLLLLAQFLIKGGNGKLARRLVLRGGYNKAGGYDDINSLYGLDDGWSTDDGFISDAYVDGYASNAPPQQRSQGGGLDLSSIPLPDRKTGVIMCAAGAAFSMLGVSLFFEKNLIRLGNILLVFGAPIVVGPKRVSSYLMNPSKLRGSIIFGLGFFLILSGHPLLGTVVELFGFFNLFGNLFPFLGAMLSRLPILSSLGLGNDSSRDRSQQQASSAGSGSAPPFGDPLDPRDFMPRDYY